MPSAVAVSVFAGMVIGAPGNPIRIGLWGVVNRMSIGRMSIGKHCGTGLFHRAILTVTRLCQALRHPRQLPVHRNGIFGYYRARCDGDPGITEKRQ